jgi:hypothetical protein
MVEKPFARLVETHLLSLGKSPEPDSQRALVREDKKAKEPAGRVFRKTSARTLGDDKDILARLNVFLLKSLVLVVKKSRELCQHLLRQ